MKLEQKQNDMLGNSLNIEIILCSNLLLLINNPKKKGRKEKNIIFKTDSQTSKLSDPFKR